MRRVIVALVAVGLALGVVFLWPQQTVDEVPDTEAAQTTTTTASLGTTTNSTEFGTTSTTEDDSHVVTSVEEAEEILRELWFGWFEGIYNQNEDRIREVVVLEETVESAVELFDGLEFSTAPTPQAIQLTSTEVLRADHGCLAVWAMLDVSAFRPNAIGTDGVYVARYLDNRWQLLSVWANKQDLWEADCESLLPSQ